MSKTQMLINFVPGEESRIAIVVDGKLEELYQERASAESHVGNIYKGKVLNVEPGIQAAFIEFGQPRNGFLHISDLHPMYFQGQDKEETEMVGQKTPRRDRPPIQKCLHRGQEILVQVLKEGIGTKGPTLTSYLSIPGRYLVMMPNMERLGVSRKVEDDEARREMRRVLDELNPPEGFGFIIRTAGIGTSKTELKRDLAYLQRLWASIERRMAKTRIGELFAESDLVVRTIRDIFSTEIEQVIVDHPVAAKRARDFLAVANPRSKSAVVLYDDPIPLFHRFDIERQIEHINARTVHLPSGGSLVIDSTEALVAIDVNSGKMRDNRDAETTAFKTNMEAADEICRQLRLRDLGGVVVNDLIDMRDLRKRKLVEQKFRDNLKRDRARTRVLPISQFGILEMTRQRMRPSLQKSLYVDCPACTASGKVKSAESVVLDVMRRLALVMHRQSVARVELTVAPSVAFQILNRKRAQIVGLEQAHNKPILVLVNDGGPADFVDLKTYDARGGPVDAESLTNLEPYELKPVDDAPGDAALTDLAELAEDLDAAEAEEERQAAQRAEEAPAPQPVASIESPADKRVVGVPAVAVVEPPADHPAPKTIADLFQDDDGDDSDDEATPAPANADGESDTPPPLPEGQQPQGEPGQGGRRRRRRRGRRGRGGKGQAGAGVNPQQPPSQQASPPSQPQQQQQQQQPLRPPLPRPPLPLPRPPQPQLPPRPIAPPPIPHAHDLAHPQPKPQGAPIPPAGQTGPTGQAGEQGQTGGRRRRRRRGGRGRGRRGGGGGGEGGGEGGSNGGGPSPGGPTTGNSSPQAPRPTQPPPTPPRSSPDVSRGYHNPQT